MMKPNLSNEPGFFVRRGPSQTSVTTPWLFGLHQRRGNAAWNGAIRVCRQHGVYAVGQNAFRLLCHLDAYVDWAYGGKYPPTLPRTLCPGTEISSKSIGRTRVGKESAPVFRHCDPYLAAINNPRLVKPVVHA